MRGGIMPQEGGMKACQQGKEELLREGLTAGAGCKGGWRGQHCTQERGCSRGGG